MKKNAFSAGVIPGGLNDKNEIKILICFIFSKINTPLKKSDITLVLQAYGLANYFEASEAFSELESNGSIKKVEDGFEITSQGEMIVNELSRNLPSAVKDKDITATESYIKKLKIEQENKVTICENKYGFDVNCSISGGEFDMLKLTLYAPDKEFANTIKNNFYEKPAEIYNKILSLFMDCDFSYKNKNDKYE